MPWMAAAAQVRKGQLVGGEVGRKLVDQGNQWMLAHDIKAPERFIEVVAPGFTLPTG
jgi:hypothetical protein